MRRGYIARLIGFFIISLIAGTWLAFAPMVNYDFYNQKVLFQPRKCKQYDQNVFGSRGREVSFVNKAGDRLSAIYFPAAHTNRKTILIHHGMANNLDVHAKGSEQLSNKLDAAVLSYDYSGFGKSQGKPSVRGLPDDAGAAYNFLVNELKVDPKTIVHYGLSLGTGPAIALAAEKPCAGLVLFAPYTSIKEAARDALPFLRLYPDWLIADSDMESRFNITKVRCPVLIIHGENDNTIRIHHGDEIYAAANQPKEYLRVPAGDHFDCGSEYNDKVEKFVGSL